MFGRVLLLLTILPFIEIYLLLKVGAEFGAGPTFGLIIITGVIGAWFIRQQGFAIMGELQKEAAAGRIPQGALIKGLFVFIGGVLLLTPGIITDAIGLSLLFPGTQHLWRWYFRKGWEAAIQSGSIKYYGEGGQGGFYIRRAAPTVNFKQDVGSPGASADIVIDIEPNKTNRQP